MRRTFETRAIRGSVHDHLKHVRGTVLQEGRAAAGGRAEVFAPGACSWPPAGVPLLLAHKGRPLVPAVELTRTADGMIQFEIDSTPELRARLDEAAGLSVEFVSLDEKRTAGGVREIQAALITGVAFTREPEYEQARAELRSARRKMLKRWL